MSYNNKYNTRHSGRFNTPGQFVPGGEFRGAGPMHGGGQRGHQGSNNYSNSYSEQYSQPSLQQYQAPPPLPQEPLEAEDVNMKSEPTIDNNSAVDNANNVDGDNTSETSQKPHWMKRKIAGMKKVPTKVKRRRQNETLRRLLTPKNALMALNEMLPNEQVANQFKVEPAGYFQQQNVNSFCADITLDGNNYKGFGDNKMMARNAAAEQAFRDIIIKRLAKYTQEGGSSGEDEEALPMIQLASFALHKLFSDWECKGHKVPQLKPGANNAMSESEGAVLPTAVPRQEKPPRTLPLNAAQMHPCMLLTYMRSRLEWRELAVEDIPPNMSVTMGVEVDGTTYIGKSSNKKQARRLAAKAACEALFDVKFEPIANSNVPVTQPAIIN